MSILKIPPKLILESPQDSNHILVGQTVSYKRPGYSFNKGVDVGEITSVNPKWGYKPGHFGVKSKSDFKTHIVHPNDIKVLKGKAAKETPLPYGHGGRVVTK